MGHGLEGQIISPPLASSHGEVLSPENTESGKKKETVRIGFLLND